jgi:hypothetical protein
MEAFVRAALLGTANAPGPHLTETPVDSLLEPVAVDGEKRLLLAAGASSVYLQAGRKPARAAALPEPAPEDPRPACGSAVTAVLRELLSGEHRILLTEACSRMAAAGLRLPPELLPAALAVPATFRPAIRQVLGERGRWLARFNETGTWARTQSLEDASADALSPDSERIWEEGSLDERVAVLRRVRAVDPALARSWLAPVLSKEKAEPRSRLLSTLETGLGPDDEELLETSLDDRSAQVRSAAGLLLARLPGSACARRLRERADALLSAEEGKPAAGMWGRVAALVSGGGAAFRLTVEPPKEVDRSWERDGLPTNPPQGMGQRAFWLVQALSRVPPAHWVERFGRGPAELLAAAARDSEWGGAVVEGWALAAIGFGAEDWAAPLWDFGRGKSAPAELKELLPQLVDVMPPAEREPRIEQLLASPPADEPLVRYLEQVPAPWSPGFAGRYLDRTRRLAAEVARGHRQTFDPWLATLPVAALALPPASFGAVLSEGGEWPVDRIESPTWIQRTWAERLQELRERVRLRLTLHKEILP